MKNLQSKFGCNDKSVNYGKKFYGTNPRTDSNDSMELFSRRKCKHRELGTSKQGT